MGAPATPAQPDCTLVAACPNLGLDPERCIDDPDLYEVHMFGALVSSIEVDEAAVDALALAPGAWFGVFADPTGACDHTVVSFEVDEPAEVAP